MKYRKPNANDAGLIEKWINSDAGPSKPCEPSFFTEEEKGRVECFVPEDEIGATFYCRAENCLRLHLCFPPTYTRADKFRLIKAIDQFTEEIKQMSKGKYKQIIFESVSEPLIAFLEKRGFRASKSEFIFDL